MTGPMTLGSTGTLIPQSGPKSTFDVTAFDPETSYTFATKMPGAHLVITRTIITSKANGTTFRHEVSFHGPAAWLWSHLYGKKFRAALPPTMQHLAELASQR